MLLTLRPFAPIFPTPLPSRPASLPFPVHILYQKHTRLAPTFRTNSSLKVSNMVSFFLLSFLGELTQGRQFQNRPFPVAKLSGEQYSPRSGLTEIRIVSGCTDSASCQSPASFSAYWEGPCLSASPGPLMWAFNIHLPLLLSMWIKRASCKANKRKITDCCCSLKLQLSRVW